MSSESGLMCICFECILRSEMVIRKGIGRSKKQERTAGKEAGRSKK
jgi:hypothetical protein